MEPSAAMWWWQRLGHLVAGGIISLLGVFLGTQEHWEVSTEMQWFVFLCVGGVFISWEYWRFLQVRDVYTGAWVYPEYNLIQPLCFVAGITLGMVLGWVLCLLHIPGIHALADWQGGLLFEAWMKWSLFFVGMFVALHLGHILFCVFWMGGYRH